MKFALVALLLTSLNAGAAFAKIDGPSYRSGMALGSECAQIERNNRYVKNSYGETGGTYVCETYPSALAVPADCAPDDIENGDIDFAAGFIDGYLFTIPSVIAKLAGPENRCYDYEAN